MSDPITVNLNDRCEVRLNANGVAHFRKHLKDLGIEPYDPKLDADGWYCGHLWEVMQIWGSAITMGFNLPFENTNIRIHP